ncbi:MAG: gliding motility-associated C-terminal domain-containing protein [Flavobacteriales bacterium]|nr:gliding motility-associated C-terminal domain-containing protein [Flavobacteriales bacterium]
MKKLLSAVALLIASSAVAQITITRDDMPNAGDKVTLSVQTQLSGFNPQLTGAGMTWDYTTLVPDSQRYQTFPLAASTPYFYFTFISDYGTRNYNPDDLPFSLLGTPPENAYYFFRENASTFQVVGEGLTVSGQALPVFYNSPDFVYLFPLNYGNKDSANSGYTLSLPNMGYFGKKQKRVNQVDGWGTLQLPFGTFETVRVHSTLYVTDSIFLDTLGFGFNIPLPIVHEYKWLAKGGKVPILQINTTESLLGGGIQTVTDVIYQDSSYMEFQVEVDAYRTCPYEENGSAEVIARSGKSPYSYQWSNGATTPAIYDLGEGIYSVTVTDAYGQVRTASDTVLSTVSQLSCLNFPTAFTPNEDGINDVWRIRGIQEFPDVNVAIYNRWGSLVFRSTGYSKPWDGRYGDTKVPPGVYYYFIRMESGQEFQGNVTVIY